MRRRRLSLAEIAHHEADHAVIARVLKVPKIAKLPQTFYFVPMTIAQ
jgi:hypothetical protein